MSSKAKQKESSHPKAFNYMNKHPMKPFMSEPEKNVGSKEVQMLEENDILLLEKKQAKTQEKIEEVDEKIKVWTENHEAFKKEREPIDLQTSTGEYYS